MKRITAATVCMFLIAAGAPAWAQTDQGKPQQGASAGAAARDMTDGEVRKVDKDAQKITIRHGPLPDLDMPTPMTMVYRVKDAAMLEKVKAGDKVKFRAENINGAFTLIAIEPAQ